MSAPWSQELYVKAWNFATFAHHGQTYGGPVAGQQLDYINHVGSVTMEVIWALSNASDFDANLSIQCALLHDVIEDTKYSYEDIKKEFGQAVADGVMALTKNKTLPTKQEQMLDSLQRIKLEPKEVWIVKLSDRITNLSPPPAHWTKEKCHYYRDEAKLILQELGAAHKQLAERLKQKIANYKKYL